MAIEPLAADRRQRELELGGEPGGPRIIDATSYFLEARALAEGRLAWPLDAPETSVLGRFLVRSAWPDGARVAVIFPPGYPALLALGFLAGAPLAVGPLLAAAITLATFALARAALPEPADPREPSAPQLAALFSVACAALRYHTADTMSHGLAALCVSAALALAIRAGDAPPAASATRRLALAAGAGLFAGWLFATRPVSALALAPVLALALASRAGVRLAPAMLAGAAPGVVLFFVHQRAATGAWGASSQALYYATSDGPEGCFRYGFGAAVGCVGEHGDFVRARLPHGYGAIEALGTTLRRLKMHLVDPANVEPLALLVPIGAVVAWRAPRARLLVIAVLLQIIAYVPFYFDGNYPAGGARFYADVLPLEHVLAALAVTRLASRARGPLATARADGAALRWSAAALALALAGFSFRAGFDHASLRDREGGRPMFEPEQLARAGVTEGLVFLDTDHGFNLAFDPRGATTPGRATTFAREHGDALDHLVWEARGRPPAFRYRFSIPPDGGPASVSVEPVVFADAPRSIEGESLWPPLRQRGGHAMREHASGTCASASRWLAVRADAAAPAAITVGLPAAWAAGQSVTPRVAAGPGARADVELAVDGVVARRWRIEAPSGDRGALPACLDLAAAPVSPRARRVELTLRRDPGAGPALVALDRLRRAEAKSD